MYHKLLLSITTMAFLSGCAYDHTQRALSIKQETAKSLNSEKVIRDYYKVNQEALQDISINVHHKWIYSLVKRIAKQKKIPLDKSYIPSREYTITAKGKYDLSKALYMMRKQTGVEYIVDDGILKIRNKSFINQYESTTQGCRREGASIFTLSLKDAPLEKVLSYFIKKKGYTVEYDLHLHENISALPTTSFSYRGCSVRDALNKLAKINNLKIIFKAGKEVIVRDYDTLNANVPDYYKLHFNSQSNSLGESKQTGTRLSDTSDQQADFKSILQTFMSSQGKAYLSGKGYLVIEDSPSSIRRLKSIINKEIMSQQDIDLDITIVSVELKDEYASGVDWNKILKPALNKYQASFGITSNSIGNNAFNIGHLASSGKLSILQLLGTYGNTKIVKEHHLSTRSGILATLKAVNIIPYVTETTQVSNGISETQREAKSVESGIIMNIKPNLDGDMVNMSVDITISEYLGDKEFTGGFKLPMLKTNNIQAPLSSKIGETILLTGIKLGSDIKKYSGLPNMQKLGDASILTGKNDDSVGKTEYLIFIKPSRRIK